MTSESKKLLPDVEEAACPFPYVIVAGECPEYCNRQPREILVGVMALAILYPLIQTFVYMADGDGCPTVPWLEAATLVFEIAIGLACALQVAYRFPHPPPYAPALEKVRPPAAPGDVAGRCHDIIFQGYEPSLPRVMWYTMLFVAGVGAGIGGIVTFGQPCIPTGCNSLLWLYAFSFGIGLIAVGGLVIPVALVGELWAAGQRRRLLLVMDAVAIFAIVLIFAGVVPLSSSIAPAVCET